jgi:hypothetical protein
MTLKEEHRLKIPEENHWTEEDESVEGWRTFHKEELHDFELSPDIIKMMKSRRMRWAGNVARMGRRGLHM